MSLYATETEFVRNLAGHLRRAAYLTDDIADSAALALSLAHLQTSAVTDLMRLAERLERASVELNNSSLDVDESERQNRIEEIENRISPSRRTTW